MKVRECETISLQFFSYLTYFHLFHPPYLLFPSSIISSILSLPLQGLPGPALSSVFHLSAIHETIHQQTKKNYTPLHDHIYSAVKGSTPEQYNLQTNRSLAQHFTLLPITLPRVKLHTTTRLSLDFIANMYSCTFT